MTQPLQMCGVPRLHQTSPRNIPGNVRRGSSTVPNQEIQPQNIRDNTLERKMVESSAPSRERTKCFKLKTATNQTNSECIELGFPKRVRIEPYLSLLFFPTHLQD